MNPFENVKALLLIVLLLLAVFLGIGIYLYYTTTPSVTLREVMEEIAYLKTAHYQLQFEGLGEVVQPGEEIIGLGFNKNVHYVGGRLRGDTVGDIDLRDEAVPYTAKMKLIAVDKEKENKWTIDFEEIVTTESNYIKINKVPSNDEINLNPFVDKWAEVNKDFFEQFIPFINHNLAAQQIEDLRYLLANSGIFKFKRKLGYNFFGFDLVRGFEVEINRDKTLEFIKNHKLITEGKGLTRKELRDTERWLDEIEKMDIELWYGWLNKKMHQVKVSGTYTEPNGTKVKFVIIMDLSDFDKDIDILAPQKSESVEDIFRGAGGLPESGESEGLSGYEEIVEEPSSFPVASGGEEVDVSFRDSDKDGLYDTFEFSFGTDPNNPDTDGDGVNDGQEVKDGTNPLGEGMLFEFL